MRSFSRTWDKKADAVNTGGGNEAAQWEARRGRKGTYEGTTRYFQRTERNVTLPGDDKFPDYSQR